MVSFTPIPHFARLSASYVFNPVPLISSSTCLLYVFRGRSRCLWPSTLQLSAFLRASSLSLLKTCPYHRSLLAFARFSTISLNPSIFINSSVFFLSTSFATYIALTIALSVRLCVTRKRMACFCKTWRYCVIAMHNWRLKSLCLYSILETNQTTSECRCDAKRNSVS